MSLIQLELELIQESARAVHGVQPPQQNVHAALCDIYRSARESVERVKAPQRKKRRVEHSSEPFEEADGNVVKARSTFVLNVRIFRSELDSL